jgi:uncharacterized membrane protein
MSIVNLGLWMGGIVLIVIGYSRARVPYQRYRSLQAADQNARKYDDWRGGRRREDEPGVTGADLMREMLRQRLRLWAGVAVVGFVLVFLGFLIR